MWTGLLWFALLTAAGLCYPRLPRTSGTLWMALGLLSVYSAYERNPGNDFGPVGGLFLIGLGVWYLIKYRKPDVREAHRVLDGEGITRFHLALRVARSER